MCDEGGGILVQPANPQTHPQSSPPSPRLPRIIMDEVQEEALQFKLRQQTFRKFTAWAVGKLAGFPSQAGLKVTWLFLSGSMTAGIRKYVLNVKGLKDDGVGRELVVRVGVGVRVRVRLLHENPK